MSASVAGRMVRSCGMLRMLRSNPTASDTSPLRRTVRMNTKPLVLLCWVQVVVVAAFLAIVFYNNVTRPSMQFDYSRTTGIVSDLVPGGVADEAGLRKGDR